MRFIQLEKISTWLILKAPHVVPVVMIWAVSNYCERCVLSMRARGAREPIHSYISTEPPTCNHPFHQQWHIVQWSGDCIRRRRRDITMSRPPYPFSSWRIPTAGAAEEEESHKRPRSSRLLLSLCNVYLSLSFPKSLTKPQGETLGKKDLFQWLNTLWKNIT